jgi:uncharacterized protein
METDTIVIENNTEKQQYEAKQDGKVIAFAEYRPIGTSIMFTHTEVDEKLEGKGVGSKLIRFALEDTKAKGMTAIPMCPFVKIFIQRHKDFIDVVHPAHRKVFGM